MIEFEGLDFQSLNELYEIGVMYYYGLKVPKNKSKAVQIFKALANKSHIKSTIMMKQIRSIRSYESQKKPTIPQRPRSEKS
jgi:TPR repeat protein